MATIPIRIASSRPKVGDGVIVESVAAASPGQVPPENPPATIRGTTVKLSIPLDASRAGKASDTDDEENAQVAPRPRRHRRDSLERREALLKGKEGSRRRQRWENDRLLNNPWAEPPLPSDWQVHATHPIRIVPYYLAPLWDKNAAVRREAERERERSLREKAENSSNDLTRVPKELRARLKKTRAAKGLLYDLEEEVRHFVARWERGDQRKRSARRSSEHAIEDHSDDSNSDSAEDEIVFVGRNGTMRDAPPSPKATLPGNLQDRDMVVLENMLAEKLVFGSLESEEGAGFARWLVHAIAAYYGLHTWSVTRGNPAHRDAYVGIDREVCLRGPISQGRLPVPLWGMV